MRGQGDMKAGPFILILAGALAQGAAAPARDGLAAAPPQRIAAPNAANWTETVTMTERGGFLMGNPDAPVKLVEYASITCPHCAEFRRQAGGPLRDRYVRSGQVSWEYRPYIIFPTDPGIFMLLRCLGPRAFFQVSEQLYADQRGWMDRLRSATEKQIEAIQRLAPSQQSRALVRITGVERLFRERGMSAGQVDACLADQSSLDQLGEIARRATQEENVRGTPSFFINGERKDTHGWDELEPMIRAALGSAEPR
jgi:protein-disulfide isomerase